jgi:amino acid adenylation domain-containing protein
MNLSDLMSQLQNLDIKLWVENDRLQYDAPSGALTNELRTEITKRKNEVIEFLQSARFAAHSSLTAIEKVPRDQPIPMSFAQQRLWFISQLEPDSPLYNIPMTIQLKGQLDREALQKSLNELIRRHESLRSRFMLRDGQPFQLIDAPWQMDIPVVDLSEMSHSDPEAETQVDPSEMVDSDPQTETHNIHNIIKRESLQPFDLTLGPLFRVRLLRVTETDHILILTMHHIVSDGWSIGILFHELSVLYESYTKDCPSPLPELPVQYADFAVWQRQWLSGQVLDSQLSYWRKQLSGEIPVLNLPTDYPRPVIQTFNGARQSIELSKELSESLKALSHSEHVTLFMTLLSAFKVLLHRYTGQEDIIVGSPIANRNRSEIEGLIGFFVNMLVLRSQVLDTQSFLDLLAQVRETTLGAYTHQDLPFEKLVDEFVKDRDLSRSPLFQVTFALQNTFMEPMDMVGLQLNQMETGSRTTRFDLEVSVWEQDRRIRIVFIYNRDIFALSTIERMMNHYKELLQGIVSNPGCRICELPLMSQPEQQELLEVWGRTQADYPRDACIHELFESQVQKNPDAMAIVFKDKQLAYSQLNERANQLAHWLIQQDISPDSLVGLGMDRSPEMIISILGILKAGGAYVPLDPGYPKERLSFMVEETQLPVLLTQASIVESLPDHKAKLFCVDTQWPELEGFSTMNPPPRAKAEDLAYVMYTSGSTGRPKGVAVPHMGVVRLLFGVDYVHLSPEETLLQLAPISFDASTFEIWGALLHGGSCVLFPSKVPSPEELSEVIDRYGVSTLWLTASLFNMIISNSPQSLKGIKQLLTGGEALSVPHIRQALEHLPSTQLINGYGPTENTTFTCCYPIPRQLPEGFNSIPIGRPIGNTQVYVLDSHMEPVPVGVPGELYIGGDGLARGYLNRPELTEERFVSDPFTEKPVSEGLGPHLYRTGDTVRWLPNGNIEFLGRMDNQVKLRGYRIELGEIESVLSAHESVGESVVLLREYDPGDKRLVGYIVPRGKKSLSFEDVRSYLRKKLPDYMVPSYFVQLESLPLTPNGKVDKQALPPPDQAIVLSGDLFGQYIGPRTPMEQALVEIWSDVLGRPDVLGRNGIGIHDNFFHLGGHSLLATQVISRVNETFGVSLQVIEMFEHPTVGEFANELVSRMQQEGFEKEPPIKPAERKAEMPLSFAQQRLWFIDQLEPDSPAYNIPLAIEMKGELDQKALQKSLHELVRHHESLRSHFGMRDGQPVQLIDVPQPVDIKIIDLSEAANPHEKEVHRLVIEESLQPFDLNYGPLFRVKLLRITEADHILLLTMHHIISDGWSMGILFYELTVLYESYIKDRPSLLPELPVQYADFAVWQRQRLSGQVLASQLDYWREQLSGNLPVLNLPTDYPRPVIQTFNGARESIQLSSELSESLKALSHSEHVTMFMTLLSAFKVLLYRYTGQEDIIVGSPVANRNRAEIEGLIGFFVNMLVLRSQVSDTQSFLELLAQVRKTTLGAYTHQDLPFERLVDEFAKDRDLSRSALFQVIFAMQNAPMAPLELVGLQLKPIEIKSQRTHFELEVHIWEREGQLQIVFVYNRDLFAPSTIKRMMNHYKELLQGILANPNCRICDLPLISQQERQELLDVWNQTNTDFPQDTSIQALFELQVKQKPEALAVVFEDQQLTYGQLNERANQLAHYLRTLGVKRGSLVAVCLERSLEMVISMLGILKAGGAYVPLDVNYPHQRLSFMLQDTGSHLLLTREDLLDHFSNEGVQVVCLDRDMDLISNQTVSDLKLEISGEDLAYVMYTSGSTGTPKGVEVLHRGVVRLLFGVDYVHLGPEETLLQLAPISFDASTFEIWGALLHGGRCVIFPSQVPTQEELDEVIDRYSVSTLWLTASLFNMIISESPQVLKGINQLLTGGEALSVPHIRQALERLPDTQLINGYGPTESTTFTCCYPIPRQLPEGLNSIPIGRPIGNTRVYVLDSQMTPVPVGIPGELYIGGDGLARGYLNRPKLTAERFLDDPFIERPVSEGPGSRLYRTGDMVRWLPEGILEFLGRKDDQVKLRGFRIELGEIESLLSTHELVREAVVLLREDEPGDKRLVGYVVPQGDGQLSFEDLRSYLRHKLPDYMVPSYFVQLESLPLTPNGKVDRKALPTPGGQRQLNETYVQPKTKLERSIANIWQEALHIDKVGMHDNFFDLGGNSLLMILVRSKLTEITKIDIPMVNLFRYPTVSALVTYLRQKKQALSDIVDDNKIIQALSRGKSRLKSQLHKSKKLMSKRS